MRIFRCFLLTLVIALAAFAAAQDGQPFRLVFANTSLSSVLRAVGIRTGANIVYVGKEDPAVTLDVTAGNADEALRFVTTAASMIYRRAGQTYIVAKPEDMRQALEPFGLRYRMTFTNVTSADAATLLRTSLPYMTVQPVGTDQILLTGTKEDIEQAKAIITSATSTTTTIVPVRLVAPDKVVVVLAEMFPDVRFRAVPQGDVGGSVIMTGKDERVSLAKSTLGELDSANPIQGSEQVFKTYEIKYSSAPVLQKFLQQAMPDVVAIMGPDNYSPLTPLFQPLTSVVNNAQNGSGQSGGGSTGNNTAVPAVPSNIPTAQTMDSSHADFANKRLPGEQAVQLVLHGSAERVDQALQMLASVDLKPKQVSVEVKVVDYSPSVKSDAGFNWGWTPFQFNESNPGSSSTSFNNVTRPGGFGTFSRVPWSFTSILKGLVTTSQAKILATPSVQVMNNEQASVFIGDTLRVQLTQATGLGTFTTTVQEFPIGIVLLLRPRINTDGDVTLHVHPVVSTITSIDANNLPQTSTREAETTLIVKNGETIVLGGLIRDEQTKTLNEVPILSKLPLIGELFRSTTVTGRKSEILVFITPRMGMDRRQRLPCQGTKQAMKVSQKDTPLAVGLVVLILGVFVWIGYRYMNNRQEEQAKKEAAHAPIVAGAPVQTAALEPNADPQAYLKQIEAWNQPPASLSGDPFREVLPRDVVRNLNTQRRPATQITGNGFDPTQMGLPSAAIDFPTITVDGVVVDPAYGSQSNFATLHVNDKIMYARIGDVIGNDLVVENVTQMGVTIRAAKEHAFIEVSKSYKPNGMAPPAPPRPAVKKHVAKHRR